MPIYQNDQSETAFRVWQAKHNACLVTNWVCSSHRDTGISFDRFSLLRYTGRLSFNLRANS